MHNIKFLLLDEDMLILEHIFSSFLTSNMISYQFLVV
ncbi:unnamed protein product [Arabidopsis halleri]